MDKSNAGKIYADARLSETKLVVMKADGGDQGRLPFQDQSLPTGRGYVDEISRKVH